MGQSKTPKPAKLIVSAFAPGDTQLSEAREALIEKWGSLDFESERLPFDHTL